MAETASKKTDRPHGGPPRLMLMDGHSLAYRAFFALPAENFTTATGQPTNAIYGFASMLANTLRDEQPTHFAVAFDVSRKTWRSEEFTEYKANRSKTPGRVQGPGRADRRAAGRDARRTASRWRASRRTTSSPRSPPRPRRRASRC